MRDIRHIEARKKVNAAPADHDAASRFGFGRDPAAVPVGVDQSLGPATNVSVYTDVSIGVSRPTVWRWQQRFAEAGVEGLLHVPTPWSSIADLACHSRAPSRQSDVSVNPLNDSDH